MIILGIKQLPGTAFLAKRALRRMIARWCETDYFSGMPVTSCLFFRIIGEKRKQDMMTREESMALYKAQSRRLFAISYRIVRDDALAEEIMQDTLLKLIAAPERPATAPQQSAWLARTCIRASIDAVRKRTREQAFLAEYAMDNATEAPEDDTLAVAPPDPARIRAAIAQLPDTSRIILTLVLVEGLDYGEISALTGEREGTLRAQYSRARKRLAALLKQKMHEDE